MTGFAIDFMEMVAKSNADHLARLTEGRDRHSAIVNAPRDFSVSHDEYQKAISEADADCYNAVETSTDQHYGEISAIEALKNAQNAGGELIVGKTFFGDPILHRGAYFRAEEDGRHFLEQFPRVAHLAVITSVLERQLVAPAANRGIGRTIWK